MSPVFGGFHQVKLPVSDVQRSLEWYGRVLGLKVTIRFVEDGELKEAGLANLGNTVGLALRHDPERAAVLAGLTRWRCTWPARTR